MLLYQRYGPDLLLAILPVFTPGSDLLLELLILQTETRVIPVLQKLFIEFGFNKMHSQVIGKQIDNIV